MERPDRRRGAAQAHRSAEDIAAIPIVGGQLRRLGPSPAAPGKHRHGARAAPPVVVSRGADDHPVAADGHRPAKIVVGGAASVGQRRLLRPDAAAPREDIRRTNVGIAGGPDDHRLAADGHRAPEIDQLNAPGGHQRRLLGPEPPTALEDVGCPGTAFPPRHHRRVPTHRHRLGKAPPRAQRGRRRQRRLLRPDAAVPHKHGGRIHAIPRPAHVIAIPPGVLPHHRGVAAERHRIAGAITVLDIGRRQPRRLGPDPGRTPEDIRRASVGPGRVIPGRPDQRRVATEGHRIAEHVPRRAKIAGQFRFQRPRPAGAPVHVRSPRVRAQVVVLRRADERRVATHRDAPPEPVIDGAVKRRQLHLRRHGGIDRGGRIRHRDWYVPPRRGVVRLVGSTGRASHPHRHPVLAGNRRRPGEGSVRRPLARHPPRHTIVYVPLVLIRRRAPGRRRRKPHRCSGRGGCNVAIDRQQLQRRAFSHGVPLDVCPECRPVRNHAGPACRSRLDQDPVDTAQRRRPREPLLTRPALRNALGQSSARRVVDDPPLELRRLSAEDRCHVERDDRAERHRPGRRDGDSAGSVGGKVGNTRLFRRRVSQRLERERLKLHHEDVAGTVVLTGPVVVLGDCAWRRREVRCQCRDARDGPGDVDLLRSVKRHVVPKDPRLARQERRVEQGRSAGVEDREEPVSIVAGGRVERTGGHWKGRVPSLVREPDVGASRDVRPVSRIDGDAEGYRVAAATEEGRVLERTPRRIQPGYEALASLRHGVEGPIRDREIGGFRVAHDIGPASPIHRDSVGEVACHATEVGRVRQ